MTEREALKLALEALQDYVDEHGPWSDDSGAQYVLRVGKEVLAQPEQEPVAEVVMGKYSWDYGLSVVYLEACLPVGTKLYTTPPQLEQEPVAWMQFRDNEPPVVAPRNLGTPVFLGIRGGLAHDAGEKP